MLSILNDTKGVVVTLDNSADNETLVGTAVDMQGFDSVCFTTMVQLGEELELSIKAQQGSDAACSDAADLEGSGETFTTDAYTNGLHYLEVHHPQERYVRPSITVPDASAAKAVVCLAQLFNAIDYPVGVNDGKLLTCPDEGTA